jgi:hypothetical protein
VARKIETILTVEENSDKMKSLVNPGIEHIYRALLAIKNSAEKDSGPTILAEDFSKTLSSLLEDDINFEGNGNDEMLNTTLTMTNLLASMNDVF